MLLLPTAMDFSHYSIYLIVTDNENLKSYIYLIFKKSQLLMFTLHTQIPQN